MVQSEVFYFSVEMNNYEKIEGRRKGSVNYVSEVFIFVKNSAVKDKIYLRCYRWHDQCKGTAELNCGFLSIVKKCDHPPEHNAVQRRKTESVIKDTAGTTCTSFGQIYYQNANENVRPFTKNVSTLKKRRSTTLPAVPNNSEEFKVALSTDMWKIDDNHFFRNVMSRLALKISEKGQDSYSDAKGYIRTQISFALLRSSVLCLEGSRSTRRQTEESSISAKYGE